MSDEIEVIMKAIKERDRRRAKEVGWSKVLEEYEKPLSMLEPGPITWMLVAIGLASITALTNPEGGTKDTSNNEKEFSITFETGKQF